MPAAFANANGGPGFPCEMLMACRRSVDEIGEQDPAGRRLPREAGQTDVG